MALWQLKKKIAAPLNQPLIIFQSSVSKDNVILFTFVKFTKEAKYLPKIGILLNLFVKAYFTFDYARHKREATVSKYLNRQLDKPNKEIT